MAIATQLTLGNVTSVAKARRVNRKRPAKSPSKPLQYGRCSPLKNTWTRSPLSSGLPCARGPHGDQPKREYTICVHDSNPIALRAYELLSECFQIGPAEFVLHLQIPPPRSCLSQRYTVARWALFHEVKYRIVIISHSAHPAIYRQLD